MATIDNAPSILELQSIVENCNDIVSQMEAYEAAISSHMYGAPREDQADDKKDTAFGHMFILKDDLLNLEQKLHRHSNEMSKLLMRINPSYFEGTGAAVEGQRPNKATSGKRIG